MAVGAGEPEDPMADFDVVATVPVVITDDLEAGRAAVAGYTALYLGGMGSREQNFSPIRACLARWHGMW